jgi:hypothetical protein
MTPYSWYCRRQCGKLATSPRGKGFILMVMLVCLALLCLVLTTDGHIATGNKRYFQTASGVSPITSSTTARTNAANVHQTAEAVTQRTAAIPGMPARSSTTTTTTSTTPSGSSSTAQHYLRQSVSGPASSTNSNNAAAAAILRASMRQQQLQQQQQQQQRQHRIRYRGVVISCPIDSSLYHYRAIVDNIDNRLPRRRGNDGANLSGILFGAC